MAAGTSSRYSGLSLFDQQLKDFMGGLRVVGRDLGNTCSEIGENKELISTEELAQRNGNV